LFPAHRNLLCIVLVRKKIAQILQKCQDAGAVMMTGCTSNFEMVLGHNIAPFDSLAPSVIIVQSKKNRLILSEYKNITKLAITNEVEAKKFFEKASKREFT
jgi:hypothetical protein